MYFYINLLHQERIKRLETEVSQARQAVVEKLDPSPSSTSSQPALSILMIERIGRTDST
jgi:hypothetical protein